MPEMSQVGVAEAPAWQPLPEPSPLDLLLQALWESAQDPAPRWTTCGGR